jgi:N-acetylglucosamine kinase-like BadF-type ATPase
LKRIEMICFTFRNIDNKISAGASSRNACDPSGDFMPSVVIGVDGGSTKTIAFAADLSGNILGTARGPGSNTTREKLDQPMGVVVQTTREAIQMAGILPQEVVLGMFTLAGADWPEDIQRRKLFLERAGLVREVIVKNDAFGGLRAGTRSNYGVVISAGTGANTAVITRSGQEWAFGYYQNYGGATDLSREAIEAVLRAEDGRGDSTLLTDMVLSQLHFSTVDDLLKALIAKRVRLARKLALCPRIFEASLKGDQVAAEIIVQHGLRLAEYAAAAIRRFDMQQEMFDFVLTGGVFRGSGDLLEDTITMAIHRVAPYARIIRSRLEPVIGALLLAYDALGIPVSEEMYTRLVSTCHGEEFFNTSNGI